TLLKIKTFENVKNQLLNYISKFNKIHIKAKQQSEFDGESQKEIPLLKLVDRLTEDLSDLFSKLKITEDSFGDFKIQNKRKFVFDNLKKLLKDLIEEVNFYLKRINELKSYITTARLELEEREIIEQVYSFLNQFGLNKLTISHFNQLTFKVFTSFDKNLETIRNMFSFSEFPCFYKIHHIKSDKVVLFVIYPKIKEDDLQERINFIFAEEIPVLKKYLSYSGVNIERIRKEIAFIQKKINKYQNEIEQIRDKNLKKFAAINEILYNIEEYIWAERQFENISSERVILNLFIPAEKRKEVQKELQIHFQDKIEINYINISKRSKVFENNLLIKEDFKQREEQEEKKYEQNREENDLREETPTLMNNISLIKPFETITKMYGTPNYSEVDPTPFIAITFPLIFGLMFGDIGHGLCLIIAGLIGLFLFKNKKETYYNFSVIIIYCGVGAVFAGFLYGQIFGGHKIFGMELMPVKIGNIVFHHPLENIMTVFIFTIILGIIHINIGWLIQFINYWRHSRKFLAFSDSLLKIFLLMGGSLLIFLYGLDLNAWFEFPYPILFPLIPGLLLFILKPLGKFVGLSYFKDESIGELIMESSLETFETILSVLSNVLSYIRILALLLAHIALMTSIQAIIGLLDTNTIFMQVISVIGLIAGNFIVIIFEGLLVFLNTIRLHFYEFFFKFYQGSGKEFIPFHLIYNFSQLVFKSDDSVDNLTEEIEKEISVENAEQNLERAMEYISRKYLD
ncbi:MAG: V-type ATP synthase subunit I, partial [archaeon]